MINEHVPGKSNQDEKPPTNKPIQINQHDILLEQVLPELEARIEARCKMKIPAEDVDDVKQDTLMRIKTYWPDFEYRSHVELLGWALQITKSHIADYYRKQESGINRNGSPLSLNMVIDSHEGNSVEWLEMLPNNDDESVVAQIESTLLFEQVLAFVESDAVTHVEREAFYYKLLHIPDMPLPEGRTRNWLNQTWRRLKKKIIDQLAHSHNA